MQYLAYIRTFIVLISCGCLSGALEAESSPQGSIPINERNLVILQYHHVSDNTPAPTSISPALFEQHMELLHQEYHVLSLDDALKRLIDKKKLPNKSVAITFDDGYLNIYENAHPILKKYNFPYTIFISPSELSSTSSQLNWGQIQKMGDLATFANHTIDHRHLLEKQNYNSEAEWLESSVSSVVQAEQHILDRLGYSKKWLAYPYGEFNQRLKKALYQKGFISFGQQSGAISYRSDFSALPRFPASGVYANLNTLKVKLNSFAMPVISVEPSQYEYKEGDQIDRLEFVVEKYDMNQRYFACYWQGKALPLRVESKIEQQILIKVDLDVVLTPGRKRLNCTVPSLSEPSRYYWYSKPIFVATSKGEFLD